MYSRFILLSLVFSLGLFSNCSTRRGPTNVELTDNSEEESEYEDEELGLEPYADDYPQAPQGNFDPSRPPFGWPQNVPGPNGVGYVPAYPPTYQRPGYPYLPPYSQQYPVVYSASIAELYRSILAREPDEQGREFWVRELVSGRPFTAIREQFEKSPEALSTGDVKGRLDINAYARLYLGRYPSFTEIQGLQALRAGANGLPNLAQQFENSQEYLTYVGAGSFFSKPIVEVFKAVNGTIPDISVLTSEITKFRNGYSYSSYFTLALVPLVGPQSQTLIYWDSIRVNCIAAFRVVRGTLPNFGDLQACTSRGNNTVVTTPNNYNTVLQQYIQSLISTQPQY